MSTTTTSLPSTYKAAHFTEANSDLQIADKEMPKEIASNQVLIKNYACGVCHSDTFVKSGAMGNSFPRVPGHEVIGEIVKKGDDVSEFNVGDIVGVGWFGGSCKKCKLCMKGNQVLCPKQQVCGISYDGGYGQYMVAPDDALARVPEGLKPEEAAPLLCAGITVFNALRNSDARAGDVVAVQGIGGLGHLAIQYSHKMGFKTVALSGSGSKKQLAMELGAHEYIDSSTQNAYSELKKMGGAKVILCTAPNAKAINNIIPALGPNGRVIIVGVAHEPIQASSIVLISGNTGVQGWASGSSLDSEETLDFSKLFKVEPKIETFPLEKAQEAYDYSLSNKARFRVVIVHKHE